MVAKSCVLDWAAGSTSWKMKSFISCQCCHEVKNEILVLKAAVCFGEASAENQLKSDSVNWDRALLPWRRSPAWLVLRVALQLVLRRCFPETAHGQNLISCQCCHEVKNEILVLKAAVCFGEASAAHTVVDGCEIMRARLGRRLYKLEDEVFPFVANRASE
jgi:hypothetical protein